MPGTETLIAQLAEASRVVHLALDQFDAITGRINAEDIAKVRADMAADGEPNADERAAAFAQARADDTGRARRSAHRQIWTDVAFKQIITTEALFGHFGGEVLPASIIADLVEADRYLCAASRIVRDQNEAKLSRLRKALAKNGTDDEKAGAEAEIAEWRERLRQDQRRLLSDLWAKALPCIHPAVVRQEAAQ